MAGFDPNRYGAKKSKNYIATQTKTEKAAVSSANAERNTFDPNTYGSGYSKNYTARHATRSVETNSATTRQAETAQDEKQNFLSRAWKTITGGLKGSAAGNMDTMGVAYQAGQGGRTQQNTQGLKDAQWALARAKRAYDQEQSVATAAELNNAMTAMRAYSTVLGSGAYDQALKAAYNVASQLDTGDMNALYESLGKVQVNPNTGVQQKATEAARDLAAQVQQSGARDIERAKTGLGTFGQMVVDAGASMAQMGGDLATNALLGTTGSMIPFATRAFGGGTMQARSEGADFGQQIAYGGALAGKEVLTEKMFNIALPFAKAYGGGALDDVTQKAIQTAVDKLGRTPAGKRALNAALQLTASGVSEGMEELIGDWMEWQMPRIYGGDVDTASETLANSLYDFVVGGMSGVAGSVISPGTYRYGNEAADVQENTAPEMNEKAAEAVEALRQGKNITGNQAAAIARDPIAVAALEQATGLQLDTEKPISELKRDIAALSGRERAQESVEVPAYTPRTQTRTQRATGGFMEAGEQAYNALRQENGSAEAYAGFSGMYNAGLNGVDAESAGSRFTEYLTPEQRYAAYNAGLQDAAAATARENAEVKRVTVDAGAGLVNNEWSRNLIRNNKGTARTLNEMGKKLGVRIEFVESVMNGKANGQYVQESNTIQIALDADNPIMAVAAHEITHRMQDLAPEEYRAYRAAAMEHMAKEYGTDSVTEAVETYRQRAEDAGVKLTQDQVMDEMAADFTRGMIEDADLFAEFAKGNRTAAQKLLDSIKEFIAKVRDLVTGRARDAAAQDAFGTDFGTLEKAAEAWQRAFDAAEKTAEGAKKTATEGGEARYQIKQLDGRMMLVIDTQNDTRDLKAAERYLRTLVNTEHPFATILADAQPVYIGKDLPKEYKGSEYTFGMNRALRAVKMQAATNLDEMLLLAENGEWRENVKPKHAKDAQNGWYRYTTEFAVPVMNAKKAIDHYTVYDGTLVIRNDADGKSYLYDLIDVQKKKAISAPSFSAEKRSEVFAPNPSADSIPAEGENVNRKFSLKAYSAEEMKQHAKDAKEFFGKTYSWNETGYITTDGTKLDFSGKHEGGPGGYRTVDHRDIRDALGDDYGGEEYGGSLVQFMSEGNIRISPESGGINLSVLPTKAQFDALSDFVSKNRGEVVVDIDDINGNTLVSTEYPKHTHSSKVVNDIKAYFETGATPRVSELGQFRYQLRGTADVEQELRDLKKERTALRSRNKVLEERVQELKGETRISKEPAVVQKDVKKLGREIIRQYGSDVSYTDIEGDMTALGKAVMQRDVSMQDLMPHARAAAEKIVDNTVELTEYGGELLDIKDYLKRQKILFNGEMDNYEDFRRSHLGTLKLNKKEGLPVDTMYAEMTEMFGEGYFPSDIYTDADKLQRIADVIDNTDAIYPNRFEGYRDMAVQEIANEIVDGMLSDQVRQKKTFADRKALEKQEAVGRVRQLLAKEQRKRKDMVQRMRREYSEKTKAGREKRNAAELRSRIARHTGPLSRKLLTPTDKQHIPEELRTTVARLLKNINLESAYSYDENGRLRKNAGGDPTKRTFEVEKLKKAYNDILDREGNLVVDPALTESGGLLDTLAGYGDKRIADMSYSELETVWNAIRAVERTLTSYDQTLSNAKYESTSKWAQTIADGSMGRMRRDRKLSLDMADPYTFFSAYGEGGMQVYRTLRDAQDREHVMLTELREEANKFLDSDVYKSRDERHTFTTGRGQELTLTAGQIMNLYNLARRSEQAMNHLTVGGIVQPEIARDGKLKAIPRGNENIPLTLEDIQTITNVLTPEQKKVADGLQKLASTKLAQWGNEASMQVYGYRKFKEEHYWPIQTAKEATASSVEKGPEMAKEIKNMGSAKALTPNATNALDIGSVYDVFAQNASDMIKYSTLLAPMEDINRLYNFRYRDSLGNLTGRNMRQVLSGVYGDAAQTYWRNLMRDVQNGMKKSASATTRAVERLVGNTKGAAVGANLRVVIQQPTAYFRAAVVLDPAYMTKGLAKGVTAGNGWDKARKYAPIAGIKDTSGFDQGSRYTIAREVYGTDGGFMEKLNDWSSKGAAWADAVTWGKIWNACEWQVAENTKLEVGSDAYYKQVAAVFTDVIDQTQVVDGIMQRTQIMRDSDALTRQATSFMGEPLKSLNILMRTYDAWRYETSPQKRSAALKQMKRAVCALLVTDVVNALAQSVVDGLRDDDKDKKYVERVWEAFTGVTGDEKNVGEVLKNVTLSGNVKGNITLIGRIPYAKDILSILQGYTVDRMDAGAIDDIVKATKSMIASANGSGKKTTAYNAKQLITMVSKIFGVSAVNLGRDTWAIARSIASETDNVRLMYEMEKAIYRIDPSAGNRKRFAELLYRAQQDGDNETARYIYNDMLRHGDDPDKIKTSVENIMKKEQGVNSVNDLKTRWRAPQ